MFLYKMNNITVIELKAIGKQRSIKGYYKLRRDELIHKLEDLPDVIEKVLIPGLEIPRNTKRSVNTNAILDEPVLDDNTPVLKPTQKCIAKSMQKRSKIVGIGCSITYHENQRWLTKLSNRLKIKLKKTVQQERHFLPIERVKLCVKKVCDAVSNRWKRLD